MKKILIVVSAGIFLLGTTASFAQHPGKKIPNEKAFEHANENARFKRDAVKENRATLDKEAQKTQKEAEKKAEKAKKETGERKKQAEKEAKEMKKDLKKSSQKTEKDIKKSSKELKESLGDLGNK